MDKCWTDAALRCARGVWQRRLVRSQKDWRWLEFRGSARRWTGSYLAGVRSLVRRIRDAGLALPPGATRWL